MTYKDLMKKIQSDIVQDKFRQYFAGTIETVGNLDINNKLINRITVEFLNPWYDAQTGGMEEAYNHISERKADFVVLLIKESAGAGAGKAGEFQRKILEIARLKAVIKMPSDLMLGMGASVQTAIYIFDTAGKHKEEALVKFIDFSIDGYTRQKRKNAPPLIKDTDKADERYAEILAHLLDRKPNTNYYTEENGLLIKEPITLDGEDWTFNQHKHIDTTITEEDLKSTIAEYFTWKVQTALKGEKKMEEHKQKFFDFYIDDIFTIGKPKKTFNISNVQLQDLPDKAHKPLITATSQDNGRTGYVEEDEQFLCPAQTLSVSSKTKTSFYQPEEWFATQGLWVLSLKDEDAELTENIGLYLLQGIRNLIGHLKWEDKFNLQMFKNLKLTLPCTDNFKIDYAYIDKLMQALTKLYLKQEEANNTLEIDILCKICGFKPPKV